MSETFYVCGIAVTPPIGHWPSNKLITAESATLTVYAGYTPKGYFVEVATRRPFFVDDHETAVIHVKRYGPTIQMAAERVTATLQALVKNLELPPA